MCPVCDNQRQHLAVRREELEGAKISLHVMKKKEVKLILRHTGTNKSPSLPDLREFYHKHTPPPVTQVGNLSAPVKSLLT